MRTPARLLALALTSVVVFIAGSGAAWADAPDSPAWPEGPERSHLYLLVLFGGGTLGLFVIVVLFGLLTARNNYVPPAPGTDIVPAGDKSPAHH